MPNFLTTTEHSFQPSSCEDRRRFDLIRRLLPQKLSVSLPVKLPPKNHFKSGRENAQDEFQKIQRAKKEDKARAVMSFWNERCREFQADENLDKRFVKATKYLAGLSNQDLDIIGAEVTLYVCNVLASMILDGKRKGIRTKEMGMFAMMWSKIMETFNMHMSPESLAQCQLFSEAFHIRFPAKEERLPSMKRRELPFLSVMAVSGADLKLPVHHLEFQLKHCGPYLERSFDQAPDPRVPSFLPDAWQRKILDAIDKDKSLFVVAPTSAGKTFISFYAMKKTLKSSNDDILVYVAPTKALVNQIAAEIQARFSKSYDNVARSVWAIHTRDYRLNNPMGCQILVTVPHILQIMLLAPSNAESASSWSLRVRRIIFDEVHCIGQAEDGVIWEQLLLLAPCPIIALSATVGNPMEFSTWLQASQKAKGFELEMIMHSSRYSDLRKFMYDPPKKQYIFGGLTPTDTNAFPMPGLDEGRDDVSRFRFIHPVVSLISRYAFLPVALFYPRLTGLSRNRGTIDDVSLESRDCLMLWRCMLKHQSKDYPLDEDLNPSRFFPEIATKAHVVEWGKALKITLETWMQDSRSPFSAVRRDLGSYFFETNSPSHDDAATTIGIANSSGFGVELEVYKNKLSSTALPLLADLHSRGALPAILFNYDRGYCEKTLLHIVKQLKDSERTWKLSSPEWKKTLAGYERWKKTGLQANRYQRPPKGQTQDEPETSRIDMIREKGSKEYSAWESFDPDAPLDMFSFADRKRLPDSDLMENTLSLKSTHINPEIIDGLRRGVGVHHSGMNRGYRQIVEMLFRKGFLTVVIATGTLAMGLNMPCKTVVFFGDSVFLSALNYLQAAGRAGRRGFDLLGNVVFTGMPPERVFEIMSSRLPDLRGHFPLSTTLVLRLLGLLHRTKNSEYAVRAIDSLLSPTQLYLGGPSEKIISKSCIHHLRFSIEYLRRQHLLSRDGIPLNFSGLVGHLYFTENATFAFHSLLKEGYFHGACTDIYHNQRGVLLELVLVLSHLFCRYPVHNSSQEWITNVANKSPSVVLLPPLPSQAEEVLLKHNQETLDIFQTYVSTFIDQHLGGTPDNRLPFTNLEVRPQDQGPDSQSFIDHLPPTKVCSPFAALSGFSDKFKSIHELCTAVRSGVFLEESVVPYIPIYPRDTAGVPWNAYIYDFFKHGDLTALVRDNGIKRNDVWFYLKDFSLILATIVTSLTNFLSLEPQQDDTAIIDVQDVCDIMEEVRSEITLPESEAELPNEAPQIAAPSTSRKVATPMDSWEDELTDEENLRDENPPPIRATGASAGGPHPSEPAWKIGGEQGLVHVLKAFRTLQEEFEEKFRKIWA